MMMVNLRYLFHLRLFSLNIKFCLEIIIFAFMIKISGSISNQFFKMLHFFFNAKL